MKKLLLIGGLTLKLGFLFATNQKTIYANACHKNVKMFSQAGASTKLFYS